MPHRVGTCFHTCYCPLEPLELNIGRITTQCTNIPSVRNCHWDRYRILDTTKMCFHVVCCTQSNEHPCRYGWTAMTSVRDTSLSGVDAVSSLDHTNGPERIWCCSNALFGSGQISTVKWHWAIYFHTNAINTNTKTTSSSNTFIHSKWRWNRIYDRQIGPFLWPVWRSASNKAKRSEHSRWIHMTGGAEVWPNPRSIIGGDATELGDVHLVEPVLCELLWSWRNNKRGREKIQYRWTKSKRKVGVFQQFSIVEHNLPFNSSVLDSIGQVIGPCESCHCWFGHQ